MQEERLTSRHSFNFPNSADHSAGLQTVDLAQRKLAPLLQQAIEGFARQSALLSFQPSTAINFADWKNAEARGRLYVLCATDNAHSRLIFSFDNTLIEHLVDAYYGGATKASAKRAVLRLSPSLLNMAQRLSTAMAAVLLPIWRGNADAQALSVRTETTADYVDDHAAHDIMIAVTCDIQIADAHYSTGLTILYPAALITDQLAHNNSAAEMARPVQHHPDWQAALAKGLCDVRLPLRSVLARPLLSVAQLCALQVGDILPIPVPRSLPLLINGVRFASGAIGDAGGQAAFRIDALCGTQDSKPTPDFLEI